ncbi:hypothetical protein RCL1_007290 [Eukaryota sp. TZLM3-RCL]
MKTLTFAGQTKLFHFNFESITLDSFLLPSSYSITDTCYFTDSYYGIVASAQPSELIILRRSGSSSQHYASLTAPSSIVSVSVHINDSSSLLVISCQTKILLFSFQIINSQLSFNLIYFADTHPGGCYALNFLPNNDWFLVHLGLSPSCFVIKQAGISASFKDLAHSQPISKLDSIFSNSHQGILVATISRSGRNIRVWLFSNNLFTKISEHKRGASVSVPVDLKFSPDISHVALTTVKPTVHLFYFGPKESHLTVKNSNSHGDSRSSLVYRQSLSTSYSPCVVTISSNTVNISMLGYDQSLQSLINFELV